MQENTKRLNWSTNCFKSGFCVIKANLQVDFIKLTEKQ